jgi:GPH family glycoside/pentoside/hexuronide:cation symporter
MNSDEQRAKDQWVTVPIRRKLAYAVGGLAEALLLDAMLLSLFPFYNIVLKVKAVRVGWALMLPRAWDAVSDFLMGQISDNTRSRWGRRRPYIGGGSLLLGGATFLLWSPPGFVGDSVWLYLVVVAFVFYTAMTITVVPYYGLGAELTIDYHERSRVQAYRAAFSRVGAGVAMWSFWFAYLPLFDSARSGFSAVGGICGAITVVSFLAVFLGSRENLAIQRQERIGWWESVRATISNRPFVMLGIFALTYVLGVFVSAPLGIYVNIYYVFGGDTERSSLVVSLAMAAFHAACLLAVPVMTWISGIIGKRRTLFVGLLVIGLTPVSSWWLFTPRFPYLQLLYNAIIGAGVAAYIIFPYSMLADICDADELRTGRRREGVFNGFFTFLLKLSYSVAGLLKAYCLGFAGFDENAKVQRPETIRTMRLMLMGIPVALIVASAVAVFFYPLDREQVREIRQTLEERRSRQAGGAR